jgi:hypothetical protein
MGRAVGADRVNGDHEKPAYNTKKNLMIYDDLKI